MLKFLYDFLDDTVEDGSWVDNNWELDGMRQSVWLVAKDSLVSVYLILQ